MPRVSVIIPTYNRAALLEQAVRSVLAQTHPDLEVIVVDDGSTDDTAKVVGSFDDLRVRYLHQAHAERSIARNRGMAEAKGAYIALLDDDDLYLPHKLARQVEFLEANPTVELVGSGIQLIDERGQPLREVRPWLNRPPQLTLEVCLRSSGLLISSVMFRRRALDRLDQWFDPDLHLAEDTDFWIRLAHAGCRMAWLPQVVSCYRVYDARPPGLVLDYMRSFRTVLDKLFARPDVPADVLAHRDDIYANAHLITAFRGFACGLVSVAQFHLLRALMLEPGLLQGAPPDLVRRVVRSADSCAYGNERAWVDYVFDRLPAPLADLQQYRDQALECIETAR